MLLRKYDIISIFQDGGRSRSLLLPVSYLLMSLTAMVINLWLKYNDFWFGKNKRPPYWNSTSGSDLDHFPVICILFCISLSNFVQIGASTAEISRHIHFSRWRPRPLNTTSRFVFLDVTAFRRSKSMSKPNFVDISNYFHFWKTNVRHIGILLPVLISTTSRNLQYSASRYRISSKSEHQLQKYDVISIFQDGGLPILKLLCQWPIGVLVPPPVRWIQLTF